MRFFLGVAAALLLAVGTMTLLFADPPPPPAGHATVTDAATVTEGGNTYLEITVHLESVAGQHWKDVHLDLAWPYQFPQPNGSTATVTAPVGGGAAQSWKTSYVGSPKTPGRAPRARAGVNIYANGKAGFDGTGDFKIRIPIAAGQTLTDRTASYKTTNNGNASPSSGVMDGGEITGVPVSWVAANNGDDLNAPVGLATVFECATDPAQEGKSYVIYTSPTLNETFTDELGIGINSETQPVPAAWNVSILNSTGTFAANGLAQPSPAITPGTSDHVFYLVCAIVDGEEILFASSPIQVTIP